MRSRWVVAALVACLAICGSTLATATNTVTITVTIQSLGVSVDTSTWAIGAVSASQSLVKGTKIVVTNTGNVAEDFTLQQTAAADWTAGTTVADIAANKYVLAARLQVATPVAGDFVDGDVVTTSPQTCNGAKFGAGGSNVAAAGTADMWLLFKTPSSSTSTAEQTVVLTMGCAAH